MVIVALALVPLAAAASDPGLLPAIRIAALAFLAGAVSAAAVLGFVVPRRRFREDKAMARVAGRARPAIASDLVSAVELADDADRHRASPELVAALVDVTAAQASEISLKEAVPYQPLRRPALALGGAIAVFAVTAAAAPSTLQDGLRQLVGLGPADPLEAADRTDEPLVGDIHITLDYPDYTGRESRTLEHTSGEFSAMPGTRVAISTRALDEVSEAKIVFDTEGAGAPGDASDALDLEIDGRELAATFEVTEPTSYRFFLRDGSARAVEDRAREIAIERDRPPSVELFAPARELEVSDIKRIELAYAAEDDYGLSELALVWEQDEGDEPERKALPIPADDERRAEGKFVWDLADVPLEPGGRVAYYIEATDNDDVSGPKTARSETYYLQIFSPREHHEQIVARLRELFEMLVHNLGDRLEAPSGDVRAHTSLQQDTEQIAAELAGVTRTMDEDEIGSDKALEALGDIESNLRAIGDGERALVERLVSRGEARSPRLEERARDSLEIIEDDVLRLADWIERTQLENMLALSDEIDSHRERLDDLLEEYERTGSSDVLAEIERELAQLEQRMSELATSQQGVPSDVMDEFVHEEAMIGADEESCIEAVRERIEAGEVEDARAELEACAQTFAESKAALEDSLGEFRGERFSAEQAAFAEVMDELADLARDQEDIAEAAQELWDEYAERAAEEMADQAEATREEVAGTLEALKEAVDDIPEAGLTPFSEDELESVERRVQNVDDMLAEGDIAEALAMARQAERGLEAMGAELEAMLGEGGMFGAQTEQAADAVSEAQPLAEELVEALKDATPEPWELMSPGDRDALDELRRRQESARERAESLAEDAAEQSGELPGEAGEAIAEAVGEAGEPMGRAVRRMLERDPSGARQASRDAAERLAEAREEGRGEARQRQRRGGGRIDDEPVRIPEAGQYEAPADFREELLEAMKRDDPPEEYRDVVRRYYEELIQ